VLKIEFFFCLVIPQTAYNTFLQYLNTFYFQIGFHLIQILIYVISVAQYLLKVFMNQFTNQKFRNYAISEQYTISFLFLFFSIPVKYFAHILLIGLILSHL